MSLDEFVHEYEFALLRTDHPSVDTFWAFRKGIVPVDRQALFLNELIKVDLEHSWLRTCCPNRHIEDYLLLFPELGPSGSAASEFIVDEFIVRWRGGDRPKVEEYQQRFPGLHELVRNLTNTASELELEFRAADAKSIPQLAPAVSLPAQATLDYRDYKLIEFIGSGGSGKVYRAVDKASERTVAVKMLKKSRWQSADAVVQFVQEAHMISALGHSSIVRYEGLGHTPGGGLFIVMQFAEGGSLAERRLRTGPTIDQAVEWILQAAAAVNHAHQSGIVHCDLKPSNLLFRNDGRVLVSDFGLARAINRQTDIHGWGGTPGFMAPEQFDPIYGAIGAATDTFALGLVFYFLITGRLLFNEDTILKVLQAPAVNDWLDISVNADLPDWARPILIRCLARAPSDRFATAAEFASRLQAAWMDHLRPADKLQANRPSHFDSTSVNIQTGGTEPHPHLD